MTKRLSVWGKSLVDNDKKNTQPQTTTRISWTKGNGFDNDWDVPIVDTIFDGMKDSKQNNADDNDDIEDDIESIKPKRTRAIPKRKARGRISMSISVSLDEEELFRQSAFDNDMNVSEFARTAMYRYVKYLKHKNR